METFISSGFYDEMAEDGGGMVEASGLTSGRNLKCSPPCFRRLTMSTAAGSVHTSSFMNAKQ
ncbi:MAG: hypothetical protein R2860_03855 [Desulfobacterales bacterium]